MLQEPCEQIFQGLDCNVRSGRLCDKCIRKWPCVQLPGSRHGTPGCVPNMLNFIRCRIIGIIGSVQVPNPPPL